MVKNNEKLKNYLHRGSCTPCGKMSHKENLERVKTTFKGEHNLNCKISQLLGELG